MVWESTKASWQTIEGSRTRRSSDRRKAQSTVSSTSWLSAQYIWIHPESRSMSVSPWSAQTFQGGPSVRLAATITTGSRSSAAATTFSAM